MDVTGRAVLRGQITKLTNAASDFLSKPENRAVEKNNENFDLIEEELSSFADRINSVNASLKAANAQFLAASKQEELSREWETVSDYEDKLVGIISRINQRLNKLKLLSSSSLKGESIQTTVTSVASSARLPKLSLKVFAGDFKDWLPFWELFSSAVHNNKHLTSVDKFNYLQAHLAGKAAECIAGFTPTESNYNSAISLLLEQFGNNDKLVDYSIQELMSLPAISTRHDVAGLRQLYNKVMAVMRSLTSLNVSSASYAVVLKNVLSRSIPKELLVEYYRTRNHQISNDSFSCKEDSVPLNSPPEGEESCLIEDTNNHIQGILRFLRGEVESLEKAAVLHKTHQRPSGTTSITKSRNIPTVSGLLATSSNIEPSPCFFCKRNDHTTQRCNSSISVSERKNMMKSDRRCFRCTRRGHNSRSCNIKGLKCLKCGGRHVIAVCDPSFNKVERGIERNCLKKSSNAVLNPEVSTSLCSSSLLTSSCVYLQTACAFISSAVDGSKSLLVRTVLDGGSQKSYVTNHLVEKLGLEMFGKIKMRVMPFGSSENPLLEFHIVKIKVMSQFTNQFTILDAVVVPEICKDVLPIPVPSCPEFENMVLADARNKHELEPGINLLIGADFYWKVALEDSRRITDRLSAINTILGWTVQGPLDESSSLEGLSLMNTTVCLNISEPDYKRLWDLDTLGITPVNVRNCEFNIANFIKRGEHRYVASLLWKDNDCVLDSYRAGALVRCNKLVQRLVREPSKLYEYDRAMNQFFMDNVAEKVEERGANAERVYYLPHRPVYRSDKMTTKLRIVFDASACANGHLSLNDNLFSGPNLLLDALAILLRFRLRKIGLIADIEKAFLQISLAEKDRDTHRFFWFEERVSDATRLPNLVEFRMKRVTFGVTCSPYLLCATLKTHFTEEAVNYPDTCKILHRSFYMDDFITSIDSVDEAQRIYCEAPSILSRAQMNLRKWNSNDFGLRSQFSKASEVPTTQKVLGLIWYCLTDELELDLTSLGELQSSAPSKRSVLQLIARIYDPIGILGPFIIRLKILFQDLWRLKVGWDEPLPPAQQVIWSSCINQIGLLKEITLPRWIFKTPSRANQELHAFADASVQGYGTVAYVRSEACDGEVYVSFLCAKNRVAPLKTEGPENLTLPKLELTACLIAARLSQYLQTNLALEFDSTFLWSDSKISLSWIHGEHRKWKPYIENRVVEIRRISKLSAWRHCPGAINPADFLTRGISAKKLQKSSIWLNGPSWLWQNSKTWPQSDLRQNYSSTTLFAALTPQTEDRTSCLQPLLEVENFSSYRRLLRVTAYIIRFKRKCLGKERKSSMKHLSANELQHAEMYWIKLIQSQTYGEEIADLGQGKPVRKTSKILKLNPFLDEYALLRVGSRLAEAELGYDATYPVLLPKAGHFVRILVQYVHEKMLHSGVNTVITKLRENFWIIKARQLVKSTLSRCRVCTLLRSRALSQPFAPLPRERIMCGKPFETIGVDFAGPLYHKTSPDIAERKKVYIMLVTCAVVRAVHLELVPSLSSESCLLALRRFFARRGIPKIIISDNACTFKKASKELQGLEKIICNDEFQTAMTEKGISWKFIAERAPWWGGFYERLVGSVKNILKIAIRRATLSIDQINTFLAEAEFIINSRPLTYVSDDPEDLSPLTPSHFLIGTFPNSPVIEACTSLDAEMRARWKFRISTTNLFFKRWKTEYLQQLRSAHYSDGKISLNLKPGDVVLVQDHTAPRILWRLAVVEKVHPGRDGRIRACELRFKNGSRLRRPVQLLYPVELGNASPVGGCQKYNLASQPTRHPQPNRHHPPSPF